MKYANNTLYTVFAIGLAITSQKISAGKEFEMSDPNQSVSNSTEEEIQRRIERIKADQYYQNSKISHSEQTLQDRDRIIQNLVRTDGDLSDENIITTANDATSNKENHYEKKDTLPLGRPAQIEWKPAQPKVNTENSYTSLPALPKSAWEKVIEFVKKKLTTQKTNHPDITLPNLDTIRQEYITRAQHIQKIYDESKEPQIEVAIEDASRSNPNSFGYETIDLEPIQDALNELLINKNDLERSASTIKNSNGYDDAIKELASKLKKDQYLKLSITEIADQLKQYLSNKPSNIDDPSTSNPQSLSYETIDLKTVQDDLNKLLLKKNALKSSASTIQEPNDYDDAVTKLGSQIKKDQNLKLSIPEITDQLQQYLEFKSLDFEGKQRFLTQLQKQIMQNYDNTVETYQKKIATMDQTDPDLILVENKIFTRQSHRFMNNIDKFIDSFKPLCEENQVIFHTWDRDNHNLIINLVDFSNVTFDPAKQTRASAIDALIKNQHLEVPQFPTHKAEFENELFQNIIKYSSKQLIDGSNVQNQMTIQSPF